MSKQLTFNDFIKRIDKSDENLLKNLRKKFRKTSLDAEAEAKKRANIYPRVRLGYLKGSITGLVRSQRGNLRALLRAGGNVSGNPVEYAGFVEFGTSKMAPRLFMFRAIRKVKKDLDKDLKNLLKISLDKE